MDQLSTAILKDLLTDFTGRNLAAHDLSDDYGGVALAALKQRLCGEASTSLVDFDLALKDLEESDLVKTGPVVAFDNPPNAQVFILGVRSKYEYAYLTEKGYKAARKTQSTKRATSTVPRVHISGGNFHQSPIGVGNHVTQSLTATLGDAPVLTNLLEAVEESNLSDDERAQLLARITAMQRATDTPRFLAYYADFMALAANHMAIIGPFLPQLAVLLNSLHQSV